MILKDVVAGVEVPTATKKNKEEEETATAAAVTNDGSMF